MNPQIWPCLKGWSDGAAEIPTSRAIYGKVHRAPSDYRWFAWSNGFGTQGPASLEYDLALKIEDAGVRLWGWRYSASGAIALKCYPSRAFDSAGRPAVVEKQILVASPNPIVPPAVMAFFLLPETVPLDDNIWWPTWQNFQWSSPTYHLPIDDAQCPVIRTADLAGRLDRGVKELLDAASEDELTQFYAQLLAENGTAVLTARVPELSPLALAAMLLPLNRRMTEAISIAGGIPSTRFDPQRLSHWKGVVCPPSINPGVTPKFGEEHRAAAADFVRKLQRSDARGGAVFSPAAADLSPGARFLITFLESPERWIAPGMPGKESLPLVGPWPVVVVVEDEEEAIYLRKRVRAFLSGIQSRSNIDERRHLESKADLLQALLLVLCPGPESLEAVSLQLSQVPSLLFAGRIETRDWSKLARYPEGDFQRLVDQSLREDSAPSLAQTVYGWLEDCAYRSDSGKIQAYARLALRSR